MFPSSLHHPLLTYPPSLTLLCTFSPFLPSSLLSPFPHSPVPFPHSPFLLPPSLLYLFSPLFPLSSLHYRHFPPPLSLLSLIFPFSSSFPSTPPLLSPLLLFSFLLCLFSPSYLPSPLLPSLLPSLSSPPLPPPPLLPPPSTIPLQANCIDSTAEPAKVFVGENKKLQADKLKPQEQITLEPYERDHAVVVGVYR